MPSQRTLDALATLPDPWPPGYEQLLDEVDPWGCGPRYFDRDGEPITMRQWSMLFESREYQQVALTELDRWYVSTVWLGLNHNFGGGAPVLFESMVFASEVSWSKPSRWFPETFPYHESADMRHYRTEPEALAGHEALCEEVRLLDAALAGTDPRDIGR